MPRGAARLSPIPIASRSWSDVLRALLLAKLLLHRLWPLLSGNIAYMGCDRPTVAEGIFDLAVPAAPEHFADRHEGFRPSTNRLRRDGIGILDIKMDGDGAAPERLRPER